jgi:hypothetical protein
MVVFRLSIFSWGFQIPNLQLLSEYPRKIIVKHKGHQDYENEEAYFLGHFPFLNANGLSDDKLYEEEKYHAAIQNRHGNKV